MTRICCVPACKSNYPSTLKTEEKVPLFKFPTKGPLRQTWLLAIKRKNFEPTHCSFVCVKHFKKADVVHEKYHGSIIIPYKYPRLIPTAVPTIFSEFQPTISKPKKTRSKKSGANTLGKKVRARKEHADVIREKVASHCEVPLQNEMSAASKQELIGSFENFKLNVASRLSDLNIEVKTIEEDVYLYNINISKFSISRYVRISKELKGYFYPQSMSLEMLDQHFTCWSEFKSTVQLFLFDSLEIPVEEKIFDLLNSVSARSNELLSIAKSCDYKYYDKLERISDEFKFMISNHKSSISNTSAPEISQREL